MKDTATLCDKCGLPVIFQDIQRTKDQTIGIYKCPKCNKEFRT